MSDLRLLPRGSKALLAVLGLLLVGAIFYAVKAEKPWGRTVSHRVEKHQDLQPKEYAVMGTWWGAVADGGLLVVLLASAKWWVPKGTSTVKGQQSTEAESDRKTENGKRKTPVLSWAARVILLGILILAAWLRAPRLDHSLWNDEEYTLRKFAHGGWEGGSDGGFVPVSWTETLFENRNGNNHLLNSLVTRESLALWRAFTHAPADAFSETALRMPAFIAGLLTIAMIFLLGWRVA
jgi:hypothetical protein